MKGECNKEGKEKGPYFHSQCKCRTKHSLMLGSYSTGLKNAVYRIKKFTRADSRAKKNKNLRQMSSQFYCSSPPKWER